MSAKRGLVIVFTGEGKGKTTAALGTALRAAGHKMRTLFVQFMKNQPSGEIEASKLLKPYLTITQFGVGFLFEKSEAEITKHRQKALEGLNFASQALLKEEYDIIVLDEILVAISLGLLTTEEVTSLIKSKPSRLHLILTGRHAPPEIIDSADTVSEIREVKHAFQNGVPAQKGIEF